MPAMRPQQVVRGPCYGRARRTPCCGLLLGLVLAAGGCGRPGVVWEFRNFEDALQISRQQDRLLLVYFRSWASVQCGEFEEQVLKSPSVLLQTRRMTCVPLEIYWDRELAESWGLTAVPAFAIVAPSGEVLVAQQRPITRDQMQYAIEDAHRRFAAAKGHSATTRRF